MNTILLPRLPHSVEEQITCRSCLVQSDKEDSYCNLLNTPYSSGSTLDTLLLSEMLTRCSNTQITPSDHLPKHMCSECSSKLINAYEFKILCENSFQLLLNNYNQNKQIKVEKSEVKNERYSDLNVERTENVDADVPDDYIPDIKPIVKLEVLECTPTTSKKNRKKISKEKSRVTLKNNKTPQITNTDKNLFTCDICAKNFSTKSNMKFHLETHSENRKRFICNLNDCKKSFITIQGFSRHRLKHTGGEQLLCHVCSKKFANKSSLETHLNFHLNEKKFECRTCNKTFFTNYTRNEHELMHTEKRFPCEQCGKTFQYPKNLRRHKMLHIREPPQQCNFCTKTFNCVDNRKRHESYVHGHKSRINKNKPSIISQKDALMIPQDDT